MKNYTITVNGNVYDVTVEENTNGAPAAAPGTAVKTGDPVVVLEIMKMETPVVAPQDGTVASVDVAKGETVESGAVLATMNA